MKITKLEKQIEKFFLKIDNLEIQENKIHGIIGGNGCGKTTLVKLIMGILTPDKGTIDYGIWQAQDVTMTAQVPYLLHESVYENIIYPLKIRKIKPAEEKIDEWLEKFGLYEKKKQYARSLSSGERQKLSFIRAIIFEPKLLIIDETFSNLDVDTVKIIKEWILEKQKKEPMTYIIISHQIRHILEICDEVHLMKGGEIIGSGTCEEMILHPTNQEIALYTDEYIVRMESEK